jgi:DNA polymerase-3 subunit epsilon/CBS domain-containing protein
LLSLDIFFDFHAVHGAGAMAEALWREAYDLVKGELGFLKLLAEAAGPLDPPIGWLGLRTENGRVDLKRGGMFAIVAAARVLALRYHILERPTRARLEAVKALKIGAEADLDALIEAHGVLLEAVLDQQLADITQGRPSSNQVDPRRLSRANLKRLKDALRTLKNIDQMVQDLLV